MVTRSSREERGRFMHGSTRSLTKKRTEAHRVTMVRAR